ncbi:MAG: xanthine dehydrogenase family protein subunit M, partial [Myxococcales bacterium]
GSGCGALEGYNRMHAILGGSEHCIAVHPSDMAVALLALDARVVVRGPQGERTVAVGELLVVPGTTPQVETTLARGELITHVTLAPSAWAARSAYVKVRDRASYAFALASAAVALEVEGGTIRQARVALGGVATRPWRCVEVEQALVGKKATVEVFRQAAAASVAGARPRRDNAFKVAMTPRVIVRALEQVAAGGSR